MTEDAVGRWSSQSHEVVRAVSAPLYCHLLISGGRLDGATADRAAEAAATAARAGVYVRA